MKKFFAIILALILVVSLVACNKNKTNDSQTNSDEYYFTAKVVDKNDASLLLEVTDVGHSGLMHGTLATIGIKQGYPDCEIGDLVKIVFDGIIQETYPCQLPNVYSVTKTDK